MTDADAAELDEIIRRYWRHRGVEAPRCTTCGRLFIFPSARPGECTNCDPTIDRTPFVLPACGGPRGHIEWDGTGAKWVSDDDTPVIVTAPE